MPPGVLVIVGFVVGGVVGFVSEQPKHVVIKEKSKQSLIMVIPLLSES
jgi:hypothetical protein